VERIEAEGSLLGYVVRATLEPKATTFVTDPGEAFQLGFVVYPAGATIARHLHTPVERGLVGTPEALVVRKGRCEVDCYDPRGRLVATRELAAGDILLMLKGGHGFRLLEDTVLLEVKLGPYLAEEREPF
jgi:hypothetical protein